jgi:hypothetical protein
MCCYVVCSWFLDGNFFVFDLWNMLICGFDKIQTNKLGELLDPQFKRKVIWRPLRTISLGFPKKLSPLNRVLAEFTYKQFQTPSPWQLRLAMLLLGPDCCRSALGLL